MQRCDKDMKCIRSTYESLLIRFAALVFYIAILPSFVYACNVLQRGPCGLMDKAPDFESGDCRFESCLGRFIFFNFFLNFLNYFKSFAHLKFIS